MIGNDVVDLKQAELESDWSRPGFLQKVFSISERKIIDHALDPNQMVWILWSMKEASYKAHQRRFYLPRTLDWLAQECLVVHLKQRSAIGTVRIGKHFYAVQSDISPLKVLSIATADPACRPESHCERISGDQMKQFLLELVARQQKRLIGSMGIRKNSYGVPAVFQGEEEVFSQFSFSGHGRFYALTFNQMKP